MGHNGCLMFCQITADEERRMSRRVFVVQHPSLVFPQFRPFPPYNIPRMYVYFSHKASPLCLNRHINKEECKFSYQTQLYL